MRHRTDTSDMRSKIRQKVRGLDEAINALKDLEKVAIPRAKANLDRALGQTFEFSQAMVHISQDHRPGRPGALLASGEAYSESDRHDWRGTIAYDDRGAWYELQRGGEHAAYIDELSIFSEKLFQEAIDSAFEEL